MTRLSVKRLSATRLSATRLSATRLWPLALLLGCAGAKDIDSASTDSAPTDSAPLDSAPTDSATESFIDGRACPPESFLTWENFGEGFMLDHCTGCHSELLGEGDRVGAPLGVDFNTQAQVQDQLDRVYARSGDENNTMPLADTLSSEERFLLGDWLACGAP